MRRRPSTAFSLPRMALPAAATQVEQTSSVHSMQISGFSHGTGTDCPYRSASKIHIFLLWACVSNA